MRWTSADPLIPYIPLTLLESTNRNAVTHAFDPNDDKIKHYIWCLKPIKAQTKVLLHCYSGLWYTVLTSEGLNLELYNNQSVGNTQSKKQRSSENAELFLEQWELLYTDGTVLRKNNKKGQGNSGEAHSRLFTIAKPCRDKMNAWLMCVCLLVAVCLRVCFIGETFFLSL